MSVIHLNPNPKSRHDPLSACGLVKLAHDNGNTLTLNLRSLGNITDDYRKVTCRACRRTHAYEAWAGLEIVRLARRYFARQVTLDDFTAQALTLAADVAAKPRPTRKPK